eukprot:PhM_4_TR2145/c0_g1_i1/m.87534/K00873/PK, pyk; pyruvate kinase
MTQRRLQDVQYLVDRTVPTFVNDLLANMINDQPDDINEYIADSCMKQLSETQRWGVREKTLSHGANVQRSFESTTDESYMSINLGYDIDCMINKAHEDAAVKTVDTSSPTALLDGPETMSQQLTSAEVTLRKRELQEGFVAPRSSIHIICTIGPKTQNVEAVKELILEGMTIARMNFSHGSHEYHAKTIECVRQAAKELHTTVAIALDTKGPEIRTGKMLDGHEVSISIDQKLKISTDPAMADKGTAECIYMDYPRLCEKVEVGGVIYVDDGMLGLRVDSIDAAAKIVNVTAACSHVLTDFKGCNLARVNVDLPAVSERDKSDLVFAVQQGVDFVFASFIRSSSQVKEIRALLGADGKDVQIVSKIENHQGLQNIDEIIEESDGIMVARGDLGIEISAEKLFLAQKMIIAKCNLVGKPVICATQMLESMTKNPQPTRAEANDVANAVLDGAHCVMLSGETAKGKYPKETVRTMASICCAAQRSITNALFFSMVKEVQAYPLATVESVCSSVVHCVQEHQAKAIVCSSKRGAATRLLAKYNRCTPIVTVCQEDKYARRIMMLRCVVPVICEKKGREERLEFGIEQAKKMGLLSDGDSVVVLQADHTIKLGSGFANVMRVVWV